MWRAVSPQVRRADFEAEIPFDSAQGRLSAALGMTKKGRSERWEEALGMTV
jgi:hypothetical protein